MEQRISVEDLKRRRVVAGGFAALSGVAAVAVATPFVLSMSPSRRTLSEYPNAPVTIDISDLAVGQGKRAEWRGEPFIVLRRSPEQLRELKEIEHLLVDPTSQMSVQPEETKNQHRSINPEFLVVSLICTHLGCAVVENPDWVANSNNTDFWKGGFDCPCHTSYFDLAGRVYKNMPARQNLAIPPHRFVGRTKIEIGVPA